MPTALVTGGAGFIGSHLVERLLAEGWTVRVLDIMETGKPENLREVMARIRCVCGNVCHEDTVRQLCAGCDVVFHLAARASVPRSVAAPVQSDRVNAEGTLVVLCAAAAAGVRRLVLASSSSVYGHLGEVAAREDLAPRPLSPYGAGKLAAEHACRLFDAQGKIETTALRLFNVYGPRQDPLSPYAAVIPRFISACRGGRAPVIYGDGGQARDFTFVADVAEAFFRAAAAPAARGQVLNIAAGRPTSVGALAERIRARFPGAPPPVFEPPRPGDIRYSCADPSRAAAALGFVPRTSIDEGLERTIRASLANA